MLEYLFTKTPFKFMIQDFWRDEAFSYVMAKQNIFQLLLVTAKDFNPPLYYITLKLWMLVFGTSEIAIRGLSVLFYWGIIYIAYLFLNEVFKFSPKKSALYLLFFVFNPLLTYYAFEARMYSMFAFFAALSFYAFHQKKFRLYQVATALGLYTHYFMIFVIASQFAILFFEKMNWSQFFQSAKKMLMPIITFIPWVLLVFITKPAVSEPFWIVPAPLKEIILVPSLIYTGYERDFGFLSPKIVTFPVLFWLSILLIAVLVFGALRFAKHAEPRKLFIFLLMWSLVPALGIFLAAFIKPVFLPRYLIFTVVGFLLLIIWVLDHMKLSARIIVLILLLVMTINYQKLQLKYRTKTHIKQTIQKAKMMTTADDAIYVTNELDFFTAQYYFGLNRAYVYKKQYNKIPAYVGRSAIPPQKVVMTLPAFPKKAVVLYDDGHTEILSN